MNKLLVICGPTATGKTALGIRLAKKFAGEIVSADSRQVYKGMDIGTGKDLPLNSKLKTQNSKLNLKSKNLTIGFYQIEGVKVWLYDIVEPNYRFSVADYVKCAQLVIEDIWKRGKLPILVGGTGFYIKALIEGIETLGVTPDWDLREKLANWKIEELQKELQRLAPARWQKMNRADRQNPRRLIRALEIIKKLKIENSFSAKGGFATGEKIRKLKIENFLMIGLTAPYKFLYQKIDQRVEERIKKGVLKEIKTLLKKGYDWENSALGTTIGYKEWHKYIKYQISNIKYQKFKEEVIQRWKFVEHGYARRQMTWFRKALRQVQGCWFDISQKNWQNKVIALVSAWYYGRSKNSKN